MKTNAAALDLIKRNEGLRLTAYLDELAKPPVWTVGYGDTGPDVKRGLRITAKEAEKRLSDRLAREFEPGVLEAIGDAPTTENQFSAMVSLAYNIGVGQLDDPDTAKDEGRGFMDSTVARMHRAGNYQAAAEAFALWNKAGGQVWTGLVRRRQEEADLYLRPSDILSGDPSPGMVVGDPVELIRQAQRIIGAVPDGIPGDETRRKLRLWVNSHPEG